MADYALEEVFEFEEQRDRYHSGHMELDEAYDLGIIDELGWEYIPRETNFKSDFIKIRRPLSTKVKCKFCKEDGFQWKQTEYGWRLFNQNDQVHECTKYEYTVKEK